MFGKILDFLDKVLTFFEEWTLFITVMVALVALFINVVLRYSINYSLAWSEELVREVIIYTTFIGCSAAIRNRSMIKIDALVQLVPVLKAPLTYFSNIVTLIFAGMMIYYGWLMAALQIQTNQKTIIMQIPLVYLYAILPLMGTMMFIRTVQVIYEDFTEGKAVHLLKIDKDLWAQTEKTASQKNISVKELIADLLTEEVAKQKHRIQDK
ncbi:MAG: TRAP transporter small permease [Desulfobacterales bacterium]|nr:TRAP transporter small permease [Desulfobacterales bacterium]